MADEVLTEIPSFLRQLGRMVSRAFYQIEDALIIDALILKVCLKDKELEDLLKFDRKLLWARMSTLKSEKFVQSRVRIETGVDGKSKKVNYYFINYKNLVNVVKYKLDHIRKKMETQERDATSRASFKCTMCPKTFTDLEAGDVFDPVTQTFNCTFCGGPVVEDDSSVPKEDSRLLLAKYNDQVEIIWELVRKTENIKLAPELLEPEPPKTKTFVGDGRSNRSLIWSGEATRMGGLIDKTCIDITIGDEISKPQEERKERPIWMTESTVENYDTMDAPRPSSMMAQQSTTVEKGPREDIMAILLYCEMRGGTLHKPIPRPTFDDENMALASQDLCNNNNGSDQNMEADDVEIMESDEDHQVPMVKVGMKLYSITEINEAIIGEMTDSEKEEYIHQFQDCYGHIYD